jgi:Divergent InlB B-repeat domain
MQPPPGPSSFQLNVTPPAVGSGTITSTPKGINCPTNCTASFTQNTQVKLTAAAGANYFFEGWIGACSGSNSCSVTMMGNESLGATFTPGETLTVSISGSGAGTVTSNPTGIDCPATCSAVFPQDTNVTLSESAGKNDVFTSWNGACSGAEGCSVTLSGANSVTADFTTVIGPPPTPSAFVYVSSTVSGGNTSQINGFSADSTGQLTPVSGSPFAVNMGSLAASGKYLFGTDGVNLYSYAVASDGSISQTDSIDVRQYNNPLSCSGGPAYLFLDRTGATLYNLDYLSDCANNSYQSSSVGSASGTLSYLGMTSATSPVFQKTLTFIGNNEYGMGASCYRDLPEIYGLQRNSDGTLTLATNLGKIAPVPAGGNYCTWWAAADSANHLAVSLTPMGATTSAPQLAVYTVDGSGNVTVNSTANDMPSIAGNAVNELMMSPSSQFLAVAESSGLEVFNFNGANPITMLTGVLTADSIDEMRWDNQNHLYAISDTTGNLYVFTVSTSGATLVAGSPYKIANAGDLAVLPETR